jgi:1,2-diacylglycerol 3-alpha-glucosyltransferase
MTGVNSTPLASGLPIAPGLRVLMLSDVYFPRVNGVSTSIQTLRAALANLGIQVTLVAPDYPNSAKGNDERCVMRVPSRAVPGDPEDRLMSLRALHHLDRVLAGTSFDLVHVQTPFAAHYASLRLARKRHLPCLATYHTHFEEYLAHYVPLLPHSWLRTAARTLARRQCNALDAVVVPSEPMRDTLREYGVRVPLQVIPTGVPESQFARGDGMRFCVRHGISPRRRVVLFVGRAAHEKNIGFLLNMLARACMAEPELLLVVAADGPALRDLRSQATALGLEAHVLFVGYLDRNTDLRDCYAAAEVFVFASQTETQGLVLLEALASGLPVLAIAALGTRSIVDPGRGAVAAATTPDAFAEQLIDLLGNRQRLAELAAAGPRFAREWAADRPARQLAGLYRSLIAHRASLGPRQREVTPSVDARSIKMEGTT